MGVADSNAVYGPDAIFTRQNLSFYIAAIANSQAAVEQWSHTPGYSFQILGFEVYCTGVTANCSIDLLIGTTSVLTAALVPVADIHTPATIKSDGSEYGDDDDIIYVKATTDGTGDLTAANFQLTFRRRAQSIS